MDLSEFLDLAYRSVAEVPRIVYVKLGLIVVAVSLLYLIGLLHRQRTRDRLGLLTRGRCVRCRYHPDAGTKTCPECGGAVIDLRLFRPVAPADTRPEADGTEIRAPNPREP